MPARIPGLTGIEHVGLTVPDLEAATRFLVDVIGAEPVYDVGPFADRADWMATHLAGHPQSGLRRMRVLKVARGPSLELIELEPGAVPAAGTGGWHLAFYVERMETALKALKAHGAEIQSGPVVMTEGPSAGLEWLYFKAPWGLQLELVSYPGGVAACRERTIEMWRPR
jgi:catechol 2,3-dioxygenase-like lactoylglutathione lyase family enzyme